MDEPIAFGTDGWRATLDVFTEERLRVVGQAVADYLADHGMTNRPIAIAYDARESSPTFSRALAEVLRDNGITVHRTERDTPTPVLAWTIADQRLSGGLMVTASHNPPEYNGVKFITPAGAPALPPVTEAIEERLAQPQALPAGRVADVRSIRPIESYIDAMLEMIDTSGIADLEIVYDAMHGSGRGMTDRLLRAAGAHVETYRTTRDPTFGGGSPEPNAANLETLRNTVARSNADLGIANDGDADRIAVVTPERGYLDESLLFAAIYDYLLADRSGPAVRTVSTSSIVDRVAADHGEKIIETPVGFKWVAAAMREHNALIGGEESGGFSIRGHVREKDGVLLALLTAAMAAAEPIDRRVDRIIESHGPIVQDKTAVSCPEPRKSPVLARVGDALPGEIGGTSVEEVSNIDGYKVTLADGGWILVRPSGTEPKLRIYAEADSPERVETLLDAGRQVTEPLV